MTANLSGRRGQPTTIRNIRVPDLLWEAGLAAAEAEGRPLSQVIRELLAEYVAAIEKLLDEQPYRKYVGKVSAARQPQTGRRHEPEPD